MKKLITLMLTLSICTALFTPITTAETTTISLSSETFGYGLPQEGYFLPENNSAWLSDSNFEEFEQVVVEGLKNREEKINISKFGYSTDEEGQALCFDDFCKVVTNNPELYYVKTAFGISWYGNTIAQLLPKYNEAFDEDNDAIFEECVNKILDETVKHGMSDEEIALSIHDYLANSITYYTDYNSESAPETIYSAYGGIVTKDAVCQGYALSYKLLLNKCGIDALYVDSMDMNHGWNMVKINDNWYQTDVTWDDGFERNYPDEIMVSHKYFLRSDDYFRTYTTPHYNWTADAPECTDNTYDNSSYPFNKYASDSGFYRYKNGYFYIKNTAYDLYAKTKFDGSEYEEITQTQYETALAEDDTPSPSVEPTNTPSVEPTIEPTNTPSVEPTIEPTPICTEPTVEPTSTPDATATTSPTTEPTSTPDATATTSPTAEPTSSPQPKTSYKFGKNISIDKDNNLIINLTKENSADNEDKLIMVVFDENGFMTNLSIIDVINTDENQNEISVSAPLFDIKEDYDIKLFVLDDLNTLTPFSDTVTINIRY